MLFLVGILIASCFLKKFCQDPNKEFYFYDYVTNAWCWESPPCRVTELQRLKGGFHAALFGAWKTMVSDPWFC